MATGRTVSSPVRHAPERIALATAFLLAALTLGAGQSGAVAAARAPDRVGVAAMQVVPRSEAQAQAFDDAYWYARKHSQDIGYPWIDTNTGTLLVSAATKHGVSLLQGARKGGLRGDGPRRIRVVQSSLADLDAIADKVTRLAVEGVPDAELIYRTEPDQQANRIIITISRESDRLIRELTQMFGPDAIAIRINPARIDIGTGSRRDDTSPFWGGATINVPVGICSSGFPWSISGAPAMLTAAHCAPSGGSVSAPSQSMGTVKSASEENWTVGTGTVYYTGQSTYRGDVALIRVSSSRSVAARIYRGGATSSSSSIVREMWSRSPAVNDSFCTGGQTSGELCDYTVTTTGINAWYLLDGLGVWARNVTEGVRNNYTGCIGHGDSGGSVFTVRSDGAIAAKGIISGFGQTIGSCFAYFTDIRLSYFGLPGVLKTA